LSDQTIILVGTLILSIGLLLAITSLVLSSLQRADGTRKSGAVVIIGLFPIIFGRDQGTARQLLVLAMVLLFALIVFYLVQIF